LNIQNLLELKKVSAVPSEVPTEDLLVDQMEEKGVEMIID